MHHIERDHISGALSNNDLSGARLAHSAAQRQTAAMQPTVVLLTTLTGNIILCLHQKRPQTKTATELDQNGHISQQQKVILVACYTRYDHPPT